MKKRRCLDCDLCAIAACVDKKLVAADESAMAHTGLGLVFPVDRLDDRPLLGPDIQSAEIAVSLDKVGATINNELLTLVHYT